MKFKCLNCKSTLNQNKEQNYFICESYYCIPNNYYNSVIFISNKEISEYYFFLQYDSKYYQIQSKIIKGWNYEMTKIISGDLNEENCIKECKTIVNLERFFPISFNYEQEIPKLINQLLKFSIFI